MLTVLFGKNSSKRAARLEALAAPHKKSGAEILLFNDANFDAASLRALAESAPLFGAPAVAVISGIADVAALRDEFEKILSELAESPQHFFLSENTLLADFRKRAEKAGAALEEFEEKNKPKKEEAFNIFLLTDAFGARKRALAWALYRKAIALGLEPREISGKIFWNVKTMLLAETASSSEEAGLHSFVYGKAKAAAKNFAPGELAHIAAGLTMLFHETLMSGADFETTLEGYILRTLAK